MVNIESPEIIYYVAAGNIVLLLLLVDNFAKLYKRLESEFTLGFLLFTLLLLMKNIIHAFITLPDIMIHNIHAGYGIEPNAPSVFLIPDILEFIALAIFLYLTRKY